VSPGDLTTLDAVKSWLSITATADDLLLRRLISAASGFAQQWMNRTIASKVYTRSFNGNGRPVLTLPDKPITAVSTLSVDGVVIPAAPVLSPATVGLSRVGYTFDDHQVMLLGFLFSKGFQNVNITYTAGYKIVDELNQISGSTPYVVRVANPWNGDRGVKYSDTGVALTLVTGTPDVGQYAVDEGEYTFNVSDKAKFVLISYSYTPFEIEQAVISLIGLRYRERDRIGQVSKTLAGEVVTFSTKDMTDDIKTLLSNYRKVVPV
jgi:hypothetical protein